MRCTDKKLIENMPDVYRVGFEPKNSTDTYYQTFSGPSTVFEPGKKIRIRDVTDGTVDTIAVAEIGPAVPWTKPDDVSYHPGKQMTKMEWPFANAIQFITMDGSYRVAIPNLSESILRQLIERNDGDIVPNFESFRPNFPNEAADERAFLAKTLEANVALIDEYERSFKEVIAMQKLRNSLMQDGGKALRFSDEMKFMNARLQPRIKKERDDLGLKPGAKVPEPKELPKP